MQNVEFTEGNDLVFISMPYNHEDKNVIEYRIAKSRELSLLLLECGVVTLSPAQIGHDLLKHPNAKNLSSNFKYWSKFSIDILSKCKDMIVLLLDGHAESTGMAAEYEFAVKHGINIVYVDENLNVVKN